MEIVPQKIIAIVGPTATGKSDLAVTIAKKIGGEIISADSRQVYTGLDIGTGKITKREMKNVTHHLIDVAKPKQEYTVAKFKKEAEKKIKEISKRGNVPIVCGGTGFYIDALLLGQVLPEVPPNKNLRKALDLHHISTLVSMLKKLDPTRAKNIDTKNRVRLIRAIEIATALGKVPKISRSIPNYDITWIGLDTATENLKNKIQIRLNKRLKAGMLAEAKRLHAEGLSWARMEALGLEYRYMALYLQKKLTKDEFEKQLAEKILQYAKRQRTWFKRNKNIEWFDCEKKLSIKEILASF